MRRARQHVLTVLTPVKRSHGSLEHLDALERDLSAIGQSDWGKGGDLLGGLGGKGIHFFRWAVVRGCDPFAEGREPPLLLLSTAYDGRGRRHRRRHLEDLVGALGPCLGEIYQRCEGAPALGAKRADWVAYLDRHRVRAHLFFTGTLHRTVRQIHEEARLWRELQERLDAGDAGGWAGRDVRSVLQKWVAGRCPDFLERRPKYLARPRFPSRPWSRVWWTLAGVAGGAAVVGLALARASLLGWSPESPGTWLWIAPAAMLHVLLLGGSLLVTGAALLATVPLALVVRRDRRDASARPSARALDDRDGCRPWKLQEVTAKEDRFVQNEVTHLVTVKEGRLRLMVLRLVLLGTNLLSWIYFRPALSLGGLRTVHFAHWTVLPRTGRLLFISNYDGSFDRYLDDFSGHETYFGVNAIWGQCQGFPPVTNLIRDGARKDPGDFIEWGRRHQMRTFVWYSAYPHLSAAAINRNTRVRRGLRGRMSPEETRSWLDLL